MPPAIWAKAATARQTPNSLIGLASRSSPLATAAEFPFRRLIEPLATLPAEDGPLSRGYPDMTMPW
jgi:hypothetical protein